MVDATIGGHPYRCIFDTGAARTTLPYDAYTAPLTVVAQHPSSGVFASHSDALIVVPHVQLGPIVKTDLTLAHMAETRAHGHPLLGMDVLTASWRRTTILSIPSSGLDTIYISASYYQQYRALIV